MARFSTISWTDITWNWLYGCRKKSEGCKNCYAEAMIDHWGGKGEFGNIRTTKKFYLPDKIKNVDPGFEKVFTCSMSDMFIEEGDEYRDEVWKVIKRNPHLIFQILTKRIERVPDCLPSDWGNGYENVWLGASIENTRRYLERKDILAGIPAKVRFWSVEPLIGKLWLPDREEDVVDWIIIGGESGRGARMMSVDWVDEVMNYGMRNGVPVFMKQWGSVLGKVWKLKNKKAEDWDEWPCSVEKYKVRQWPKVYDEYLRSKGVDLLNEVKV